MYIFKWMSSNTDVEVKINQVFCNLNVLYHNNIIVFSK